MKRDRSEVQNEMVELFGSEKQKRAFAAYKRNKVGGEALEMTIASAVAHAGDSVETTGAGTYYACCLSCCVVCDFVSV